MIKWTVLCVERDLMLCRFHWYLQVIFDCMFLFEMMWIFTFIIKNWTLTSRDSVILHAASADLAFLYLIIPEHKLQGYLFLAKQSNSCIAYDVQLWHHAVICVCVCVIYQDLVLTLFCISHYEYFVTRLRSQPWLIVNHSCEVLILSSYVRPDDCL
jgi:hypothetical protein